MKLVYKNIVRAGFFWQAFIQLVAFLLPWHLRRLVYLLVIPGWQISASAKISRFSIILSKRLRMEDASSIKPFVYLGSMKSVFLSPGSSVGMLNWISGSYPSPKSFGYLRGCLRLGRASAITSMHRVDCSGGFCIGAMSILAGYFSQVLTHGVDLYVSRQVFSPVRIGKYCFVGTRATILPGTSMHDCSALGASSLLLGGKEIKSFTLWAGVPAKFKKNLPPHAAFFTRQHGYVL